MKAAAELFSRLHGMTSAEQLQTLKATKGHELAALMHYLEGCERVTVVEQLMFSVLAVSGRRYLAKKAEKAAKRTKRIF
jgi:hypothetical protein